jgi:hypothetical protein
MYFAKKNYILNRNILKFSEVFKNPFKGTNVSEGIQLAIPGLHDTE